MNQTEGLKNEQCSLLSKRLKKQSADIYYQGTPQQARSAKKGSLSKPSYRQYKLSEAYRTFVMGYNSKRNTLSQAQPFRFHRPNWSIGEVPLLNQARSLRTFSNAKRKHCERCTSTDSSHHTADKYIRLTIQMRLEYNGLTSNMAPRFSCRLLEELNIASEPKKTRKRRLFLSNFCIPKSSANLLSSSSAVSEFKRFEIDGVRLD